MTYKPNIGDTIEVIIIDGLKRMEDIESVYEEKVLYHEVECERIRNQYTLKTSRVKKNNKGDIGEYTNWYMNLGDGRLIIHGKDEPNYAELYPDKPPEPFRPGYERKGPHIIMEYKDFLDIKMRFRGLFVFDIEEKLIDNE